MKEVSNDIISLLEKKYSEPFWVVFKNLEFHKDSDYLKNLVDLFALSIGLNKESKLHGFSVQFNRLKWLEEIRNSKKNQFINYCDYKWIIALPNIIKLDEIPANYGFQVIEDNQLKTIINPSFLNPKDINRSIMTLLIRNFIENKNCLLLNEYNRGYRDADELQLINK